MQGPRSSQGWPRLWCRGDPARFCRMLATCSEFEGCMLKSVDPLKGACVLIHSGVVKNNLGQDPWARLQASQASSQRTEHEIAVCFSLVCSVQ